MQTATLTSPKIMCGGCVATVTDALKALPGVESVSVDLPTKRVSVTYAEDAVTQEQIRSALSAAGYPANA